MHPPKFPVTCFPTTPMQEFMISETLRFPKEAGAYIEQMIIELKLNVDVDKLTKAWIKTIEHHKVMRLAFLWKKEKPLQYLIPLETINIEINDWSNESSQKKESYLNQFLQADRHLGISLFTPPLFRISLLNIGNEGTICIWTFHHAIADKRSMSIILNDFLLAYETPDSPLNPTNAVTEYSLQYGSTQDRSDEKAFWLSQIKCAFPTIPFQSDAPRQTDIVSRRRYSDLHLATNSHTIILDKNLKLRLERYCELNTIKMKYLFIGAWTILLGHYSGHRDIFFGAEHPIMPSHLDNSHDTGVFTNILPFSIRIRPEEELLEFLNRIRNKWHQTEVFNRTSMTDIQNLVEDENQIPPCNVFFSYEEAYPDLSNDKIGEREICSRLSLMESPPGALFFNIRINRDITIDLQYDRRLFKLETIKRITDHLTLLLSSVKTGIKIENIAILTPQEKHGIYELLNTKTAHPVPSGCIHHYVEIQSIAMPNPPAVYSEGFSMSYGQLNQYANQIARLINASTQGQGKKIVLLLDRDDNFPAAILGILKSGNIYVSLDTTCPLSKLGAIIAQLSPELIISSSRHRQQLAQCSSALLLLDEDRYKISAMPTGNLKIQIPSESSARISYPVICSENPKGMVVSHSALTASIKSTSELYDIQPDDFLLHCSPLDSDRSTEEIFISFFSGGTLVISPFDDVDGAPEDFMTFIREHNISILSTSLHFFYRLIGTKGIDPFPDSLRTVLVEHHGRNTRKAEEWQQNNPQIRLISTYRMSYTNGPVTWRELSSPSTEQNGKVSMGTPLPGASLCILNRFQQPALEGTKGELYISSPQLATVYPDARQSIEPPFLKLDQIIDDRLFYKSGTVVELTSEGELFHHGRGDRQIEIKGVLINLNTIEATIRRHPLVSDCAIVASSLSDSQVATKTFLVIQSHKTKFSKEILNEWLLSMVPEFVIPDSLMFLDAIPRSGAGKIDYDALSKAEYRPNQPLPDYGKTSQFKHRSGQTGDSQPTGTPIILIGNSTASAQKYKQADTKGHPFFHTPIFIHFYACDKDTMLSMDIGQLARKCIAYIQAKWPAGPYIIMGSCQNSIVAHEVACQLTRSGETVELLVIIDENWKPDKTEQLSKAGNRRKPFWLTRKLSKAWDMGLIPMMKRGFSQLKKKTSQCYTVLDGPREKLYMLFNMPVPEAIQFRKMETIFYKACEANPYTPQSFSGRVLLLYSYNWIHLFAPELNRFFTGKIQKLHAQTDHNQWFDPRQINGIIQAINSSTNQRKVNAPDRAAHFQPGE